MKIQRERYLQKLIQRMHNGMIKVISGIRRSGKSYLLFEIFYPYLLSQGIRSQNIIRIALDSFENSKYRDPDTILDYIHAHIENGEQYRGTSIQTPCNSTDTETLS